MSDAQSPNLTESTIELPFEQACEVSDQLLELGALAVCMHDAQANSEDESPLYGEPGLGPEHDAWRKNILVALFNNEQEADHIFGEVPQELLTDQKPRHRQVPNRDWVGLTQAQFEPIEITPKFWIVQSWSDKEPAPGEIHLQLDPGLAFGTGSHPTTALCLRWTFENPPKGQRVLDYGCGSGILGIGALKLGASEAIGVDIDPQAVRSTLDNAQRNDVVMPVGLTDFEAAKGEFPVVLANILSNPLKVLAPSLCAHVEPGGHLVLSGILSRQAEEVIQHYTPWINLTVWAELDGWVCLHGIRKGANS